MNKRSFVFVWESLSIGGVEDIIVQTTRYLIRNGYNVLILYNTSRQIDESYRDLLNSDLVTFDDIHHCKKSIIKYVSLETPQELTIITFSILGYLELCNLKDNLKNVDVDVFFQVQNFKGSATFLEDNYSGLVRMMLHRTMCGVIKRVYDNGQLRVCSPNHLDAIEKRYGFKIGMYEDYVVPTYTSLPVYDEDERNKVWSRDEFNIVSVSRFEFPHKGYLIGLIKAYGRLKKKYPQMTLTIIGYGEGEIQLRNEILKLDKSSRKDINIIGKQPYEELEKYYRYANLNISAAGCCIYGASIGVLSLPVRHYHYSCEVYGFLPESLNLITSEIPGENVDKYIECAITMKEKEYRERCRRSYEELSRYNSTTSILDKNSPDAKNIHNTKRLILFQFCMLGSRLCTIRNEGIVKPVIRRIKRLNILNKTYD